jgi:catechol 2,3-dioxygenase-like lactoylglutathione lyase family enzyme
MAVQLTQNQVEVGMTVADITASLAFYRDTLGFAAVAEVPLEWGGTLHILRLGDAVVKLADNDDKPTARQAAGGATGATGTRWITLWVSDVADVLAQCEAAGRPIPVPLNANYPGVKFGMVEDPDGTWIEFVETTS